MLSVECECVAGRSILAGVLALSVPIGAMCAPFLHAHVDEDADHHHPTSVHAHLSGHPSDVPHNGATLEEPDHDRAIYLQTFVAVQPAPFDVPAIAPTLFVMAAPPERPAHVAVDVTHGHDPPLATALDSRPPPCLPDLT